MPVQRFLLWFFFAIVMMFGIPGLAHAIPQVDFRYGQMADYETRFDALASDPAGIARYTWNFGDGSPEISTPVPTAYHEFPARATYSVTLRVMNKASPPETGTVTKQVTMDIEPVCTPPECTCTPSPCMPYTCAPGTFADCAGGCGTQCKYGTLEPYADFTYRILGADVVLFDASLSFSQEGIAEYFWDFGDGTSEISSTAPLITHSYSTDGTYWVTLKVKNKGDYPKGSLVMKEVTVNWFVCTAPACTPPGTLTCPTYGCPGGCGVECIPEAPIGVAPVMAALAVMVLIGLRRQGR